MTRSQWRLRSRFEVLQMLKHKIGRTRSAILSIVVAHPISKLQRPLGVINIALHDRID